MYKKIINKILKYIMLILICLLVVIVLIIGVYRLWYIGAKKKNKNIENFIVEKSEKYIFYKLYLEIDPVVIKLPDVYDNGQHPSSIFRLWCWKDPIMECGGRKASLYHLNMSAGNTPGWNQVIYGDYEAIEFLYKYFGENHRVTIAYFLINPEYGVARADLMRYLLIYIFGGIYLDMKSCIYAPLEKIPDGYDMVVSPWKKIKPQDHLFQDGEYQNWFIYARKGSPILGEIIEKVVQNIFDLYESPWRLKNIYHSAEKHSKGLVLATTGPIALTSVILNSKLSKTVFVSNTINDSLNYMCQENIITEKHYSNLKTELVTRKIDCLFIKKTMYVIDDAMILSNTKSPIKTIKYTEKKAIDLMAKFFDNNKIIQKFKNNYNKKELWLYCMLYMYGGIYNFHTSVQGSDDKPLSIGSSLLPNHLLKIQNKWFMHYKSTPSSNFNTYDDYEGHPGYNNDNGFYTRVGDGAETLEGGDGSGPGFNINNICIATPVANNIFWKLIMYILNNPSPSTVYEYTDLFFSLVNQNNDSKFTLEII